MIMDLPYITDFIDYTDYMSISLYDHTDFMSDYNGQFTAFILDTVN